MSNIDQRLKDDYESCYEDLLDFYNLPRRLRDSPIYLDNKLLYSLIRYRVPSRIGFRILETYLRFWSLPRLAVYFFIIVTGVVGSIDYVSQILKNFGIALLEGRLYVQIKKVILRRKEDSQKSVSALGRLSFDTLLLLARSATPPDEREFALGCLEERFEQDRAEKGVLYALWKLAGDIRVAYWSRIKGYLNKQVSRARKSI